MYDPLVFSLQIYLASRPRIACVRVLFEFRWLRTHTPLPRGVEEEHLSREARNFVKTYTLRYTVRTRATQDCFRNHKIIFLWRESKIKKPSWTTRSQKNDNLILQSDQSATFFFFSIVDIDSRSNPLCTWCDKFINHRSSSHTPVEPLPRTVQPFCTCRIQNLIFLHNFVPSFILTPSVQFTHV